MIVIEATELRTTEDAVKEDAFDNLLYHPELFRIDCL